ncbi:MAG TPA: hypothetical protein PLT38_08460 [Rubrivivax sp.]|nr:hypothetical protein [Rubrivivax sp.]
MAPASSAAAASAASSVRLVRRHWLALCLLAALAPQAAGEPAVAPPRLRFRSRRAVCDCGSDLDEEAIESAQAARSAAAASAAAAERQMSDESKSQSGSTTTRRTAP